MQNQGKVKTKTKSTPIISRYSRWIRVYSSARHDPKILSMPKAQRWEWMAVLMVAGDTESGILPPVDHLACELRMSAEDTQQLIDDLIFRGLIDIVDRIGNTPVLRPHEWDKRQYKSDRSADRMRQHRERKREASYQQAPKACDVTSTVTVTTSDDNRSDSVYVIEDNISARDALWPSTSCETLTGFLPGKNLADGVEGSA